MLSIQVLPIGQFSQCDILKKQQKQNKSNNNKIQPVNLSQFKLLWFILHVPLFALLKMLAQLLITTTSQHPLVDCMAGAKKLICSAS